MSNPDAATEAAAPTVSILIPVYNNEATLEELASRLLAMLPSVSSGHEIVLVNDGSHDGSWSIIERLAKNNPCIMGLKLSRNFGQHPAISAGLAECTGEITVLMDADLQDLPEELPRVLAALDDESIDIAYTTWEMDGEKAPLSSRVFHAAFSRITSLDLPQNLGTYRAFREPVREALMDYPERGAVYGPLMHQMGFGHSYVPVKRAAAIGRESSYTFKKRLALAASSLLSYSDLPHRAVTWLGVGLSSASALYLMVLVVQYAIGNSRLANGQTLLIGITVLMSGVLLLTVGVLLAYTYRVFQEVLHRPRYHVARRTGRGLEAGV